jgi:serine/threonine-protein kinase
MNVPEPRCYTFGEFRIDAVARRLSRRDGTPVTLTARVFDTLLYLVRHAGTSLGKDELLAAIWPGRVVEDNNLTQSISTLRKVLGAESDGHGYIVTEPGRGYRFVADVQPVFDAQDAGDASPRAPAASVVVPASAPEATVRPSLVRRIPGWLALGGLLALGLIAGGAWFAQHRSASAPATAATTNIAVLPFKPLLGGDRDEVLELGMADTLITKLSNNRRLSVRSLGSVRKFGSLDQDPLAAGRELAVGSVLEGQVQRRADRVHVSARLLNMADGAALWSGTFDENFTDVFALQDTIAQKVATALALTLDSGEQRAMKAGYTRNSDAYLLYLQGRYRIGKATPPEIHAGMAAFRKAIDLDPTFALAHAELAEAYRRLPITSDVDPKEAFPLAKAAANKALEIDSDLAEAHSVLGWVAFWYDWDWNASEKEFRRAIELNPSVAEAHLGYGHLLSNTGRDAQAAEQGRLARELDPLSPLVNTISAGFLAGAHRADEARAFLSRALEIDPDFWIAHYVRGNFALGAKNYPAAIVEFTHAREHSAGSLQATSMLGFAMAQSGDRVGAQALLDELTSLSTQRYVPATTLATICIGLGDADQTLAWLNRAYDERDVRMAFLKVDRRWDPLRADPRFVALAKRIGLP